MESKTCWNEKKYRAADILRSIGGAFIFFVTEYTMIPRKTRVLVMYSSLKCKETTISRRPGWTSKQLKAFGERCEFRKEDKELFSSVCTLVMYTMKIHLLDHFVEVIR